MPHPKLTRRAFLKLSGLGLGSLALYPPRSGLPARQPGEPLPIGRGRVSVSAIYRYLEPDRRSERLGIHRKDEILKIYGEMISSQGPAHNPRWYALQNGFVHSGTVQRVDGARLNIPPLQQVPESGILGEISVPYTQSYRPTGGRSWKPLYRLYYSSIYWITGVEHGPQGGLYYRLTDDLLHVHYFVPALHVRPLAPWELAPIAPDVPPEDKEVVIKLGEQSLVAYERGETVLQAKISTGVPGKADLADDEIPTETPTGRFRIQMKMPSRHMGDGELTADPDAYELPGVPWVAVFHKDGYALHGTYWHDNFGARMSHGCVNLENTVANWLFRWTTPEPTTQDWYLRGPGTTITIT